MQENAINTLHSTNYYTFTYQKKKKKTTILLLNPKFVTLTKKNPEFVKPSF